MSGVAVGVEKLVGLEPINSKLLMIRGAVPILLMVYFLVAVWLMSIVPKSKLETSIFSNGRITVISEVAVKPPSTVSTVMVEVPLFTAVTKPAASTVATEGSLLVQVRSLLLALLGITVAVRLRVSLVEISFSKVALVGATIYFNVSYVSISTQI